MSKTVHKKIPRPLSYWLRHKRQKCKCLGYWFPHRKGGGACEHSSKADYYHALRQGLSQAEAMQLLSVSDLEKLFPLPDSTPSDDSDIPF